jgi:hypothetical protein
LVCRTPATAPAARSDPRISAALICTDPSEHSAEPRPALNSSKLSIMQITLRTTLTASSPRAS